MPKLFGGGAERVLINLLCQINYSLYDIDLYVGVKGGILENEIPNSVNVKYIFPHRIFEIITSISTRYLGVSICFMIFGQKIKKDYDVGISYIDCYYSNFLLHSRGQIKRKVVFIHSSPKTYSNKFKHYKGESIKRLKKRYECIDTIVSVSNEALNEFIELYGSFKDLRVVYNPLNIKDILNKSTIDSNIELNNKQINLMAVGSHIPVKGYENLILACQKLKEENISFILTILGEGKLKQYHQELINTLGLKDNIHLTGFVKNPYPLIRNCDIFVMTSIAEGLPTSLCEALVLGKPVIVTNVPGCREVVDGGKYGLMVENTVISIAQGLKLLIVNKDQRLIYEKKAIERARFFDDKQSIEKYYEIFNL